MIRAEKGTRAVYAPGEPDVQYVEFHPVLFWATTSEPVVEDPGKHNLIIVALVNAWESDQLVRAEIAMDHANHLGKFLGIAMPGDSELEWHERWLEMHRQETESDEKHDRKLEDEQALRLIYRATGEDELPAGFGLAALEFFNGSFAAFSDEAIKAWLTAYRFRVQSK